MTLPGPVVELHRTPLVVAPGVDDGGWVYESVRHPAGQVVAEFTGAGVYVENPDLRLGDPVVDRQAVRIRGKRDPSRNPCARPEGMDHSVVEDPVLGP